MNNMTLTSGGTENIALTDVILNSTNSCTITYPGTNNAIWYTPYYVPYTYSNQLNIEKVENGFIVKYESKTYVAGTSESLNKLVNKLLVKENK